MIDSFCSQLPMLRLTWLDQSHVQKKLVKHRCLLCEEMIDEYKRESKEEEMEVLQRVGESLHCPCFPFINDKANSRYPLDAVNFTAISLSYMLCMGRM